MGLAAEAIDLGRLLLRYWALAAHLLQRMPRSAEARAAFSRAIGLCEDPAMRDFLAQQTPAPHP
jgi:predicted RNA polymerase sigma factor